MLIAAATTFRLAMDSAASLQMMLRHQPHEASQTSKHTVLYTIQQQHFAGAASKVCVTD